MDDYKSMDTMVATQKLKEQHDADTVEVSALKAHITSLEAFIETIDHQYDAMQQIKQWCNAYPLAVFPEPDWVEVKDKLGDKLMSRVAASNMRHVVDGIQRIITECEKNHSQ